MIRQYLQNRSLNLTTLGILADARKHRNMSAAEFEKLIAESAGKSRSALLETLAKISAVPEALSRYDLRDQIVPVFVKKVVVAETQTDTADPCIRSPWIRALAGKLGHYDVFSEHEVITEKRLKLTFSAEPDFADKMQKMRQLLSGRHTEAVSLATIFSEAMDCYIKRHCPIEKARRNAERRKPKIANEKKPQVPHRSSRYIPADVKAEVMPRDNFQCTYVAPDGTKCGCRSGLEIDHIQPFAAGGGILKIKRRFVFYLRRSGMLLNS